MVAALSLSLVLATASSVAPAQAAAKSQVIEQTISADGTGKIEVDSHPVEAGATTIRVAGQHGQIATRSSGAEARVLIEVRARPVLDRKAPGSVAEAAGQRQQLARDLIALDERLKSRSRARITREYDTLFSGVAATVDSRIVAEIRRLPNVAAVHEDAEVHANAGERKTSAGFPAFAAIGGFTGAGVKVAVIDTGIDYTHPDLGGCFGSGCKVAGGHDFVNNDDDPQDGYGHGTHVAGIIAADGTLKGVAPGVTLLAYKALNQWGSGYDSDIIAALEAAVTDGAKVANLSFGGSGYSGDPLSQAVDNATVAGMLSVEAAGNSGPAYLTIGSPGLAGTALTVGAIDNSDHMAAFSSRGYVTDGDDFVMKPEVVAPGVNILSTVPTTGPLGDPSGYATLSGTSMATPYVAGSAALLLEWNASQSPQELKNRLAGSARTIGADPFSQGAGAIDLQAAFDLPVLASMTHLSFGVVDATTGIVDREQTLSIRNTAPNPETLSLTASALPAGTTLEILPSSLTLQAGESTLITLRLHVDASITPEPPDPQAWSYDIVITDGSRTLNVPGYFFKGSVLTLMFDEAPWFVQLYDPSGTYRAFYSFGNTLTTLGKNGLWDVLTYYLPPVALVAREHQNVQGHVALSIGRSQATHTVEVRALDDTQQPLRDVSGQLVLTLSTDGSGFGSVLTSISGSPDFKISDLSFRVAIGISGGGSDPSGSRLFLSNWSQKGLASDVLLPTHAPFRQLAQAAARPPGTTYAYLTARSGFVTRMTWGAVGSLQGSAREGELSRTLYLQSNYDAGWPMVPVNGSELYGYDANYSFPFVHDVVGPYLHYLSGTQITVSPSPFLNLPGYFVEPDAILDASIQRWDLDTAPNYLPLHFTNTSSMLLAHDPNVSPFWSSQTLGVNFRYLSAAPEIDVYRLGVLVGTYPIYSLGFGIASPAGAHEIHSASQYSIHGVAGSSQVVASFDTSKPDPNPPFVTRFRIEQNGIRTATPAPSTTYPPIMKFRVTDDSSSPSVTVAWRMNGTTIWQPLTTTNTGSDYSVVLQQEGSIDLQLTATDSSGNAFQEVWTPALITTAPAPPTTPASITASRAGATSINVTWAPSASQIGISGYRIERLPGAQTFTTSGTGTSFSDSSGLVKGNAYFYRVSAIDTNNTVSSPTAYDVATLIQLADDPVVPGFTLIRGTHIADLRRAIDAVRLAAGLANAWVSYAPPTGLVAASDFIGLHDRLNEARTAMQIPGVQFSQSVAPGVTIRGDDLQALRNGVK